MMVAESNFAGRKAFVRDPHPAHAARCAAVDDRL